MPFQFKSSVIVLQTVIKVHLSYRCLVYNFSSPILFYLVNIYNGIESYIISIRLNILSLSLMRYVTLQIHHIVAAVITDPTLRFRCFRFIWVEDLFNRTASYSIVQSGFLRSTFSSFCLFPL